MLNMVNYKNSDDSLNIKNNIFLYKTFLSSYAALSIGFFMYLPINTQAAEPGVGNLRPAYSEGRLTDTNIDASLSKFRNDIYNPIYNVNAGTDSGGPFNDYLQTNFGCASISACKLAGNSAAIASMVDHFQDYALDLTWLRPDEIPTAGTTIRDYTPGSDYNKQVYTLSGGSFEGYTTTIAAGNYYQFVPDSGSLGGVVNDPNNPNTGVYRDTVVDNSILNVDGNAMFISRPTSHVFVVGAVDGATINFNGQYTYIVHMQDVGSHGLSVGYWGADESNKDQSATVNANNLTVIQGTGYMHGAYGSTRSIIVGREDGPETSGLIDSRKGLAQLNVNGDLNIQRRGWAEYGYAIEVNTNGIATVSNDAKILLEGDQQIAVRVNAGQFNVNNNLSVVHGISAASFNNTYGAGVHVRGGILNVGNDFNLNTFVNGAKGVALDSMDAMVDGNIENLRSRFYVGNNFTSQIGAQQFVDYTNNNATGPKDITESVIGLHGHDGDLKVDGNFKMELINANNSTGVFLENSAVWIDGDMALKSEGKNNVVSANNNLTGVVANDEKALLSIKGTSTIDMQTDTSVGVSVVKGQVYLGTNGLTSPTATDFKKGNYTVVAKDIALVDVTKGSINTGGKDSQSVKIAAASATEAQFSQSQGTTVSSSGDNSTSVLMSSGSGKASFISNGIVSSSGAGSNAVDVLSASGNIILQQGAAGKISTTGVSSIGVKGSVSGTATLDFAQNAGGVVETSAATSTAVALNALNGKITGVLGGQISTQGINSDALNVIGSNGEISLSQAGTSKVTTSGDSSDGVSLKSDAGNIKVEQAWGGTFSVAGASSNGLNIVATAGNFDVTLAGKTEMSTTTTQADYAAVKLLGTGKLVVEQSAQILTNQDNIAILKTDNANIDAQSAGKIIGSILLTGTGDNTLTLAGNSSSTVSDMKQIDGGSGGNTKLTLSGGLGSYLLNAYSDGTGAPTGLPGETFSQIFNWKTVDLVDSSRMNMVGDVSQGNNFAIETFNIGFGSTLSKTHIQDTSLKADTVNNKGTIDLRNATDLANNTMTITGNYVGSTGSTLLVSTHWNNDPNPIITGNVVSSLSQTDHLQINGTAVGSTKVVLPNDIIGDISVADIKNPGTYEKLTKPVITVETDHVNAPAVFTGSAQTTNAGEAQLVKRGNDYVWVLQASNPEKPLPPTPPSPPSPPSPPILPSPPVTPDPVAPIYSQAVSAYVQMPRANMELGYDMLGTFHERVGEPLVTQWDRCGYNCAPMVNTQSWVRITGKHAELDGKKRLSYKADTYIAQAGQDLYTHYDEKNQGAKTVFGIMGTYARLDNMKFYDKYRAENGVIASDKRTGQGSVEAGGLGLYLTRIGAHGAYLDVVGQVNYYSNKYDPRGGAKTESQDGYGVVLSAEVGAPYMIGQSRWYIEPQAQLIYQYVDLDDFHDGYRKVNQDSIDGLRGRVGFRMAYNAPTQYQRTKTFFIKGNVWHDFNSSYDVALGRDIISEDYNDTWGEIGAGLQLPVSQSAYLFSDVSYSHSFSNEKREEYRGNLGLKVEW